MDDNSNNKRATYTVVDYTSKEVKKEKSNFGRTVLLPFCSGVLGATFIIGTCFGVPTIREKLIGNINFSIESTESNNETSSTPSSLSQISLSNYSDTGIKVAEKVRPSIVGIEVEYSVNSIFSRGRNSKS